MTALSRPRFPIGGCSVACGRVVMERATRTDGNRSAQPTPQAKRVLRVVDDQHQPPPSRYRFKDIGVWPSQAATSLRQNVEQLSGVSLGDVRVHLDSPAPTEVGALAFTRGNHVHVGPGQERHLAHEMWHAVQQKQGRVRPTAAVNGGSINDAVPLETEADRMGRRSTTLAGLAEPVMPVERPSPADAPMQMVPDPAVLAQRKLLLRRADHGVTHANLPGIRSRRSVGQSAPDYYEHLVDTRRSMARLMSRPAGRQMLEDLNAQTANVTDPGHVVDEQHNPATVVDVSSGAGLPADNQMQQTPRHDGTYGGIQRAYRYDGQRGAGQASRVNYNHTAPSANRFNSLGHEMVHAWRVAHGTGVSPPEVSPRRNDPILAAGPGGLVGNIIGEAARQREEFETVGLQPTPGMVGAPTENLIRNEHGLPQRTNYSGVAVGALDQTIVDLDGATDDRSWWDRAWNAPPRRKVTDFLRHLAD